MPMVLDPVRALEVLGREGNLDRAWWEALCATDRNMWCTAPLLHAAGRAPMPAGDAWVARQIDDLPPGEATALYDFEPVSVAFDAAGQNLSITPDAAGTTRLFTIRDQPHYAQALRHCLTRLLIDLCQDPPPQGGHQ
jgi:hypothetical protein